MHWNHYLLQDYVPNKQFYGLKGTFLVVNVLLKI